MQFITFSNMLAAFNILLKFAICATVSTDPTTGSLAPAKWIFENINGVNVTLYGTASNVTSQLKALDLSWEPHNLPGMAATIKVSETAGERFCCPVAQWDWPYTPAASIQLAASNLKKMGGTFEVPANSCSEVDCWAGAGIWVCNDTDESFVIPTADAAQMAYNFGYYCPTKFNRQVCGQQFDSQGWNVIGHAC